MAIKYLSAIIIIFMLYNIYENKSGWILSTTEQSMFGNYYNGNGNIKLSKNEFERIRCYIEFKQDLTKINGYNILLENGSKGKSFIISFYGSPEFDHAFGTATIYVDQNNNMVGFMDYYDFDSRSWGERSYTAEIISRSIKLFSTQKAKPFKITYGLQAITPIYDVVRQKLFSRSS